MPSSSSRCDHALRCTALLAALWACTAGNAWPQEGYHFNFPEQRSTVVRQPAELRQFPLPPSSPPPTVAEKLDDRTPRRQLSLDEAIRVALGNDRVVRILAGETAVNSGQTI